ncbi:hypothetical protein BH09BAC1_BH09BAC1_03770 [soil metagenome]
MKILLWILAAIAVVVITLLITAIFIKKDYTVKRDIIINAPKHIVFDYIRFLKNQDYYNKWVMTDPNMKKSFTGTDGTVGFVYGWNGNKEAGEGELILMGITEGERVDQEIRFVRPMEAIAQANLVTTSIGENQTKVEWLMSSEMKYPFNAALLVMDMDKILGKDLQISLGYLKDILENKANL